MMSVIVCPPYIVHHRISSFQLSLGKEKKKKTRRNRELGDAGSLQLRGRVEDSAENNRLTGGHLRARIALSIKIEREREGTTRDGDFFLCSAAGDKNQRERASGELKSVVRE